MAENIICNCCGGAKIVPIKGKNLGKCSHCGATIIMPRPNEEIIALLNSAYLQRANYDFDAAIKTYEFALTKDDNEKSAYEGLLLAKYGIEYVKDPRTNNLIPTCHRTHFASIYEDDAYQSLLTLCNDEEKEALIKKVEQIDKLQKAIAKQLEREEDFDVFISYKATDENGEKTEDSIIARNIYDQLTKQNYKVFFAEKTLEDRLGSDYEPIIFKAIHTSKIFVLVGTKKEYINSVWVKNEWTRFIDRIKTENDKELTSQCFIPVFKDMSPNDMPKINNKFVQGVDASKLGYEITVADGVNKYLKPKEEKSIVKTINSFEDILEMKKAQKKAKKDHYAKKFDELKKDKKKYVPFLIAEILCFVLPVVMIGLILSEKFVYPQYPHLWCYIAVGVLWIPCFVSVLIIRSRAGLGQSVKKIVLSATIFFIAIVLIPATLVTPGLHTAMYDYFHGYDGIYCGAKYSLEDGKVVRLWGVDANSDNSTFVIPDKIDGHPVNLSRLFVDKGVKKLVIQNTQNLFDLTVCDMNLIEVVGEVSNLQISQYSNYWEEEMVVNVLQYRENLIIRYSSANISEINVYDNVKKLYFSNDYASDGTLPQIIRIGDSVENVSMRSCYIPQTAQSIIYYEGTEEQWNQIIDWGVYEKPDGITVLFNQQF